MIGKFTLLCYAVTLCGDTQGLNIRRGRERQDQEYRSDPSCHRQPMASDEFCAAIS
jgi:hypothetical protein